MIFNRYFMAMGMMILAIMWLVAFIAFNLLRPRYIFGMMPSIKARDLTKNEKERIRKFGISHCTDDFGYEGIIRDKVINMSKGDQAYSNQYKPCVFFCINDGVGAVEGINRNTKYTKKIVIKNLSQEQISEMKIRPCDEALLYQDDFSLSGTTYEVESVKVKRKCFLEQMQGFLDFKNDYNRSFWISSVITLLTCTPVIIFAYIASKLIM